MNKLATCLVAITIMMASIAIAAPYNVVARNIPSTNTKTLSTTSSSWCFLADVDRNHIVNLYDLASLLAHYGSTNCGSCNTWCDNSDIDRNGMVDAFDLGFLRLCYGRGNS